MAPPPSSTLPLQQRVLQLAQTLQFGWFVGHLTLLVATFRYFVSYLTFHSYSRWARVSYRLAFVSAAITYGIVVYKGYRARLRAAPPGSRSGLPPGGILALAGDENVQYLAMAIVWLSSKQYALALLPFAVYSTFHFLTYVRTNLIPTIQPPTPITGGSTTSSPGKTQYKQSVISEKIGTFVKGNYDHSMRLVALLEILLWVRLFGSAIIFAKGSWILLAIYTAFLRARHAQSQFVAGSFKNISARVDGVVSRQDTPPVARQIWETIKGLMRQFVDVTDLSRYLGGHQGTAPKKAQ